MDRDALITWLRTFRSVAVAFSGGVDSSVLLGEAVQALGVERVWALTAESATFPQIERESLARVVDFWGVRHAWVPTRELDDAEFRRNDRRRCYYCKRILFRELGRVAERLGAAVLLEGSNVDDAQRIRPGAEALAELGIPSPLQTYGYTKADIRRLAADWGLSVAEKLSTPCLATRLAYGLPITAEVLQRVERAEQAVREILAPSGNFRVRVHEGGLVRLELSALYEAWGTDLWDRMRRLTEELRQLGFRFVTLDLDGFCSGSWDTPGGENGVGRS